MAADPGSVEIGSVEIGSVEIGSVEIGSVEIGSVENGSIENGSTELGAVELRSLEFGYVELESVVSGYLDSGSAALISNGIQLVGGLGQERSRADLDRLLSVLEALDRIIVGKHHTLRLALTCLLAGGHLLIEDVPGVGKTTLAQALARVLGMDFRRIQFTSDMMPADIIGASVYQRSTESFRFERGPLFAQMVLADEINRASPKTQSALLEAMQEEQVTVDGISHRLPQPFFVIATRNPVDQIGTFALPESQLDRFLMQIRMGYPDPQDERELLLGRDRRELIALQEPVLPPEVLEQARRAARQVHVAEPLLEYLQSLLRASRESREFIVGLSPRSGLALLAAARAWAYLAGRPAVYPDDIQAVLPAVVAHRLQRRDAAAGDPDAAGYLLRWVQIP